MADTPNTIKLRLVLDTDGWDQKIAAMMEEWARINAALSDGSLVSVTVERAAGEG